MSKQAPQKSRLGRGLNSLINLSLEPPAADASAAADIAMQSSAPASPGMTVVEIPLRQIVPNPHQPRRNFDQAGLKELAESMRTTGVIQPVVARATADGQYELIAGERRWRAAKLAGLETVPAIVRTVDPVMQAQMALIENVQRQDLNPIERASAYKALLDNLGLTHIDLADRLGEERSVIGHYVRLLELAPAVQAMVGDGRLSFSHAKLLAGVSNPDEQTRLAELAVSQGLNLRNLERLIAGESARAAPNPAPVAGASAHLLDLEKAMSRQLGMRVQVKSGRNP